MKYTSSNPNPSIEYAHKDVVIIGKWKEKKKKFLELFKLYKIAHGYDIIDFLCCFCF